jgi:hypothetical protein
VLALALISGCGGPDPAVVEQCADVVGVATSVGGDGSLTFSVTVRSDDIGWDGYADRWEVVADEKVVGERVLAHPHETEQPFTRSQAGIVVSTDEVVVRAHHSVGGFCGSEMVVVLD